MDSTRSRRVGGAAALGAVLLWAAAGPALAALIQGTPDDDVPTGTAAADTMFGEGGNDTMSGGGANDVLHGGPGDDTVFTFHGSRFQVAGDVDTVACGDGDDTAFVDDVDTVAADCETVFSAVAPK